MKLAEKLLQQLVLNTINAVIQLPFPKSFVAVSLKVNSYFKGKLESVCSLHLSKSFISDCLS